MVMAERSSSLQFSKSPSWSSDSHDRRRHRLRHRPAEQRRFLGETGTVALADDPAAMHDDHGAHSRSRHRLVVEYGGDRRIERLLHALAFRPDRIQVACPARRDGGQTRCVGIAIGHGRAARSVAVCGRAVAEQAEQPGRDPARIRVLLEDDVFQDRVARRLDVDGQHLEAVAAGQIHVGAHDLGGVAGRNPDQVRRRGIEPAGDAHQRRQHQHEQNLQQHPDDPHRLPLPAFKSPAFPLPSVHSWAAAARKSTHRCQGAVAAASGDGGTGIRYRSLNYDPLIRWRGRGPQDLERMACALLRH
jgi:hypothetical protein